MHDESLMNLILIVCAEHRCKSNLLNSLYHSTTILMVKSTLYSDWLCYYVNGGGTGWRDLHQSPFQNTASLMTKIECDEDDQLMIMCVILVC